jgi:capsular exopolysaccharide synthesis family protein
MTFRQALNVVWRRRLMIIAVILLAMGVAAIFLVRQTPVYTSPMTVRMSALAAAASSDGQIGTAAVDFSPETITSPAVLGAAAQQLGEPASATGAWNVTYELAQTATTSENPSVVITVSANGTTAAEAQKHVTAVAKAYEAYLDKETASARKAAEAQVIKWTAQAQADQAVVDKNPANSIAQSSLASAINSLASANDTITKIDNSGRSLITMKAATPGEFQGTSPLIALAVALAAGLVAGIGIVLIWDAFDDRLRPEDDIEDLTGAPALGELSLDRAVRRGRDRLPAAGRARTTLNEGLRSLRTTLQVLLPSSSKVIVVTSVEPGDGKTFISSNLALTWARMGKRVVLIGGDLRKAGLEEYFGEAAAGVGLTELLQSASLYGGAPSPSEIADSVKETPYDGLSILPSGAEPWDPADLLALGALGDIIASIRGWCDVIIIDSPPSLALVDARLLAAHADGVVVVASMRRTRRRHLSETVHALEGSGNVVLGTVTNRSRRPIPASYSEYYGRRRQVAPATDDTGDEPFDETAELDDSENQAPAGGDSERDADRAGRLPAARKADPRVSSEGKKT